MLAIQAELEELAKLANDPARIEELRRRADGTSGDSEEVNEAKLILAKIGVMAVFRFSGRNITPKLRA